MLLGMPHCDITIGNDMLGISIVMSRWALMLLCVHIIALQWIMTLPGTYFAMYYYA